MMKLGPTEETEAYNPALPLIVAEIKLGPVSTAGFMTTVYRHTSNVSAI